MRNIEELNINEGGAPPRRTAPSLATIATFERACEVRLPDELKLLLSIANGGHPELDAVGGVNGQFGVSRFYHLTDDDHGIESLWYATRYWRPILGKNALPFAFDGGNKQFFLDMAMSPPMVKLWVTDEARAVDIAASFEQFIDLLEIDPEMI